ncbi:1864_t:CDS:2 [Funneliformis caledonium]|uniref:1864_t:CDS:1 n=1 Tax=Funneliformis caledonium TaxID=1117310 RepID=A0A9N8ZFI8_9GLOM|nr:1864_t:CDS:2 [Funneliformis caledonium]
MFQLIRNRHSGNNILRIFSHTTRGKDRYITSSSTAQVLPDNLNSNRLDAANEDDELISQQSERDEFETSSPEASSPDEWKFLFETVIEEEKKERERHPSSFDNHDRYDRYSPPPRKRQSSREEIYRESQKRFIPFEKNEGAFHRIFRTLLDSKNYERWKDSRLDTMNEESKSSTIEQYLYDLMRRGEKQQPVSEQQGIQLEREHDVPNESMKEASSLSNVFNEPENEAIEIKNELLKCEAKIRFQEIISKNIFGVDHENSIKSKRVVDDFNRPFPFRYEMLLNQSILLCNIKFKDPHLALSIFEQTKRRGLLSYVLGCSTRVYNQILLIRWEFWKDIKGIERLLDEMKYNGVSFNDETFKIISDISLEVASYTNSEKWDLFDIEAYKNVLKLFKINEGKL